MTKLANKLQQIAQKIDQYFTELNKNDFSIFLCGGASKEESSFRLELKKSISQHISKYNYNVHLPEDLFLELIMGYQKYDSLNLENILANSVNSIVIPLQSPGTFTELGAFSNRDDLVEKIIVVMKPKFKNDKSFINTGPIKKIREKSRHNILYYDLDYGSINAISDDIRHVTRIISAKKPISGSLKNPFSAMNFYFCLIYVFEPILKSQIDFILKSLDCSTEANIVCETVLSALVNQRKIFMDISNKYYIQKDVQNYIETIFITKKMKSDVMDLINGLRFEALNTTIRRSNYRNWGKMSKI